MKENIKTLKAAIAYGGKLYRVLGVAFTQGTVTKIEEEYLRSSLSGVIDQADKAERLEKENEELRAELAKYKQPVLF